jgi:hypothetical protein
MITGEPFVQELLESRRGLANALAIAVVGGTLGLAWLRNRRALTAKEILS